MSWTKPLKFLFPQNRQKFLADGAVALWELTEKHAGLLVRLYGDFPGGLVVKGLPSSAGIVG